jgi:hypothetical protein
MLHGPRDVRKPSEIQSRERRVSVPVHSWLLLLFSLPATHKTARVAIWRKLQKSGAIQIKTSTYLLPDTPQQYELFQWLAKQVADYGGESTLIRAREIEGLSDSRIISLFNAARDADYAAIADSVRKLSPTRHSKNDRAFLDSLEKLRKTFWVVRDIDFFDAPKAHLTESLLARALNAGQTRRPDRVRLDRAKFRGKTWVTRPRPEIDRVASGWLIRTFIDPQAIFRFAPRLEAMPAAIPFDYSEGEFSHEGDGCTFEMLLLRFGIADKALRQIGEMVHDADLEDEKFQRTECIGLDRIFKGWAKRGMSDDEILARGAACFDGLYAFLRRL